MATNIFDDNYMWDVVNQFFDRDSLTGVPDFQNFEFGDGTLAGFQGLFNNASGTSPTSYISYNDDNFINMGKWRRDWMNLYMPQTNEKDYRNIGLVGQVDKTNKINDIINKGYAAGNDLYKRAIQGGNTYSSFIYDRALATGRLSDFSIYNEEKDFERAFQTDLFSTIGDIAQLGAFNLSNYSEEYPEGISEMPDDTSIDLNWLCGQYPNNPLCSDDSDDNDDVSVCDGPNPPLWCGP